MTATFRINFYFTMTIIPFIVAGVFAFETITLAPIDRTLIDASLLSQDERTWLNAYHARVFAEVGPQLDGAEKAWLESATAPI